LIPSHGPEASQWPGMLPFQTLTQKSHPGDTATEAGAAANQAAANKIAKYDELVSSHIFYIVAIETGGTWNHWAVEVVREIGRRSILTVANPETAVFLLVSSSCRGGVFPWLL